MHFTEITLPQDQDKLIACYLYTTLHLRALWTEYVNYVERTDKKSTAFVFSLIFSEMDFYEGLRLRISELLPHEVCEKMRYMNDYSGW